ncbi:hypothetical protein M413DRAFT_449797 [Hebeloma cylindrosporum]|uniref:Uncharacterized protein n=1 Tax=Hebeloma cylindrosporum TaxID=76867 RepID=A0A0C2XBT4_HEBCY|nr:hypothetical protein M413DRAFT_449797 [Hebeloma cylindrosporum h7]
MDWNDDASMLVFFFHLGTPVLMRCVSWRRRLASHRYLSSIISGIPLLWIQV